MEHSPNPAFLRRQTKQQQQEMRVDVGAHEPLSHAEGSLAPQSSGFQVGQEPHK